MATTETFQEPKLGEPGEGCAECGSPLAADQRYCLECGTRRGDPRLDYARYLSNGANGANGGGPPEATAAGAKQPGSGRDWTPFVLVGLVAGLGMMLAIGVLIGKGGSGSDQAAAPVVQVGSGTGTDAGSGTNLPTADTEFKGDWPEGKEGFTIEIGSLAKQGTTAEQVEAAKTDATDKGAPDVGALDSDDFGSLPSGNYVIYSGVYDSKADATKDLKSLQSDFPEAQVIEVSAKGAGGGAGGETVSAKETGGLTNSTAGSGATVQASKSDIEELHNTTGEAYQEAIKHIPDNIETPGKEVKEDNKDPGAGGPPPVVIK
jgi:hypothetical protein